MADVKVAVAYVHEDAGRVTSFEESLTALIGFDGEREGYLQHGAGRLPVRFGTDGLPAARNAIAVQVMTSDVDWVLVVDTDMGFEADALYRLLQVADPVERPVVGALCFAQRQVGADGLNGYRVQPMPTIYAWHPGEDDVPRFASVPLYPVNSLVRTPATGSAFILIHRSVFERIAEVHGPTWYDRTPGTDGRILGEDISFCVRAATVEIPIFVHTGVRTTHFKEHWLGETDHWRAFNPPPATAETAVIVPVLRRPQNAESFMTSLRASTGLATVYAVCEPDDHETAKAWQAAGARIVWGHDELDSYAEGQTEGVAHTFAQKVNLAYRLTEESAEPWLFLTGDDVRFRPGWLDHAQHVGDMFQANVVGTNDLANPRVLAGEHATHLLVRRSYVDEVGASWEGPGVVANEAYHHWYVDDEIVTAAQQRGVWQMALGSVVEHLHPFWGKAEDDEVYQLGQSHAEDDKATWLSRLAANS